MAPGIAGTDAVNLNQLNAVGNDMNSVDNLVNSVDRRAASGTATAIAMSGISIPDNKRFAVGLITACFAARARWPPALRCGSPTMPKSTPRSASASTTAIWVAGSGRRSPGSLLHQPRPRGVSFCFCRRHLTASCRPALIVFGNAGRHGEG